MRGRKRSFSLTLDQWLLLIKKESPNEGTETTSSAPYKYPKASYIKKESPNEGTETDFINPTTQFCIVIKKESPNEGTETKGDIDMTLKEFANKKRIPE